MGKVYISHRFDCADYTHEVFELVLDQAAAKGVWVDRRRPSCTTCPEGHCTCPGDTWLYPEDACHMARREVRDAMRSRQPLPVAERFRGPGHRTRRERLSARQSAGRRA